MQLSEAMLKSPSFKTIPVGVRGPEQLIGVALELDLHAKSPRALGDNQLTWPCQHGHKEIQSRLNQILKRNLRFWTSWFTHTTSPGRGHERQRVD